MREDMKKDCRAGIPMPAASDEGTGRPVRRHLRRLDRISERIAAPLFYITCCVRDRRSVLAQPRVASVLAESWQVAGMSYRWPVGCYVIMPEHVHFFASPLGDEAKSLSGFVGGWKRWTQREIRKAVMQTFAWQAEFFDHLLRSDESYESKWEYVRANPVRAGLVASSDEWPFQGEMNVLAW